MKKIMVVTPDNGWYPEEERFLDVSTPELMDKAYVWLFKNLDIQADMEEEINNANEDYEDLALMKDCNFCNKTGKLKLENRDETVVCTKCHGSFQSKYDKAASKKWNNDVANFRKAQKGDIKAIKKFMKDYSGYFLRDCWSIEGIIKT